MKTNVDDYYLKSLRDEFETSSFWQHMSIKVKKFDPGDIVIQMPVTDKLMNTRGIMHGGAIASLLDSIIGISIRSEKNVSVTTINLSTQFIAPAKEGILTASAKIIKEGRTIIYAESKILDDKENLIGVSLGTFKVKPLE